MFHVVFEKAFKKDLEKLDKNQAKLILYWIKKNLDGIDDPKTKGKALQGALKKYWRYRIGDYRLITEINNKQLIIICLAVGYRKIIYKSNPSN